MITDIVFLYLINQIKNSSKLAKHASDSSESVEEPPEPLSAFEEKNRFDLLSDDDREEQEKAKAEEKKNPPAYQPRDDTIPKYNNAGYLNSGVRYVHPSQEGEKEEEEKKEGEESDSDEWT